jgi:thiol-disulfide isomerase/thioredoxin
MAPDFSFTLYQGEVELGAEALDLSDLRGRPTVLNFWAGLCPPCRAELPDLQLFYEDFNDRVTVVGVDIGTFTGLGNQDDARNLLRELAINYPNGYTSDDSVVRRYQVLSMPTTFFINSKGEIFKKWNGALNRDILTEQTTELLNQESGS